ncbi:hypothetical protein [Mucilaginibacter kameinonensis]|uniref:hypothetical protein n=1 Tax=Mucilaginibacter kameinonensis TaxID=452286 RepID=UPI000EF82A54|nr:hypothetical protein [Mucilaginibacter kameinonensis]
MKISNTVIHATVSTRAGKIIIKNLPDETRYFIFVRNAERTNWVCTDKRLQDWLDASNILALRLLEEVWQ